MTKNSPQSAQNFGLENAFTESGLDTDSWKNTVFYAFKVHKKNI
jgi:hypothetical protein